MSSTPQFTATPNVGIAALSAANTGRDGTGTIVTVLTAGANGSRVDKAVIKATGVTTDGMVRLFIHNVTAASLFTEVPVTATAASSSTPAFESVIDFLGGLVLPTGYSLRAATEKAETFNVVAFGGNF
ncbi:MAG: hypothetical protein ACXV8Q_04940 [Methylobacter sp.]